MISLLLRNTSTIGVIGAGQMGTGIAIVGANTAKLNVKIFDNSQEQNSRSVNFIDTWHFIYSKSRLM